MISTELVVHALTLHLVSFDKTHTMVRDTLQHFWMSIYTWVHLIHIAII